MNANLQQIINGILATVIGGALLSFWPPFRKKFLYLLNLVSTYFYKFISKAFIIFTFKFNPIMLKLFPRFFPNNYKNDVFFEVEWHWNYDNNFKPILIASFCPTCKSKIEPRTSGYKVSTFFKCENCGFGSKTIKTPPLKLKELIAEIITEKIMRGQKNDYKFK